MDFLQVWLDRKETDVTVTEPAQTVTDDASDSHSIVEKAHRVLHLGHPSDPNYGAVEELTPAQYAEFVRANTWPSRGGG